MAPLEYSQTDDRHLYIKDRIRSRDEFLFFMHQFVEECRRQGFKHKKDILPSYRFFVRSISRRFLFSGYRVIDSLLPRLLHRKQALIVTSKCDDLVDNIFPYYGYEIIPMLWDVWPAVQHRMLRDLKRFHCKTVFVTVRSVAQRLKQELGINAYWIPEGIDTSIYHPGLPLAERPHHVLEMGRQHPGYHQMLTRLHGEGKIAGLLSSNDKDGMLHKNTLTFPSMDDLCRSLPQYQVLPCFPQCDTNPGRAGDIETLTQRYWEGMLSRNILIGRAPQELIDLVGYNPVVDVDWDHAEEQILHILNNIADYQPLVDKNRATALEKGTWAARMPLLTKYLEESGYKNIMK